MGAKGMRRCPRCGAREGVRIIYGSPPLEVFFLHERGLVFLGECRKRPDSPDWHCRACEHQWKEKA